MIIEVMSERKYQLKRPCQEPSQQCSLLTTMSTVVIVKSSLKGSEGEEDGVEWYSPRYILYRMCQTDRDQRLIM
jgi:hypothetical protein